MPQLAAYDDVKSQRKQREIPGGYAWRTNFITPPEGVLEAPMAFLAEGTAKRVIRPHFHDVDQFQVIVSGGGVLGRHALAIHAVHFTRAHTPYGPIVAGNEGLGFLTLRPHWDQGAQYLPETRERLASLPGRTPWQATELPVFAGEADVNVHAFQDIKDDRGLACFSIKLKPNATGTAPDPSRSRGQYIIVTKGSLAYQGKEHGSITIGWVGADEKPFELVAGPQGAELLVLNFPRVEAPAKAVSAEGKAAGYRVWQCELCAFVYDEAAGMPAEGIAPGTRWEDVPDDWICPDCAAGKADFQMSVVG